MTTEWTKKTATGGHLAEWRRLTRKTRNGGGKGKKKGTAKRERGKRHVFG